MCMLSLLHDLFLCIMHVLTFCPFHCRAQPIKHETNNLDPDECNSMSYTETSFCLVTMLIGSLMLTSFYHFDNKSHACRG